MGVDDLAALFDAPPPGPSQDVRFRQGVVVTWDPFTAHNTVLVGGTLLTDLPILNTSESLLLEAGSVVAIAVIGQEPGGARTLAILGRMTIPGSDQAASAMLAVRAESASVLVSESTTTTTYTNLATYGPEITITVGPTGRLLVMVGAEIAVKTVAGAAISAGSGFMCFEMSGANVSTPLDDNAAEAWIRYDATPDSTMAIDMKIAASRVTLLTGLTGGETTLTAKYRASATGAFFDGRNLTAIAL